jgi:hypothetical protein
MVDDSDDNFDDPDIPHDDRILGRLGRVFGLPVRKEAIFDFFLEVTVVNLAFWNRAPSTFRKDLYLSTVAFALVFLARSAFAASANPIQAPAACSAVLLGSAFIAGLGCVIDPKCSKSAFLRMATSSYRVIIVGVIISAFFIALNLFSHWASTISYWLSDYFGAIGIGYFEMAVTPAVPAALLSFILIFLMSLRSEQFRQSWRKEPYRVSTWAMYFFTSLVFLNIIMFLNFWPL